MGKYLYNEIYEEKNYQDSIYILNSLAEASC